MRLATLLLTAILLTGCSKASTPRVAFPELPPLPESIAADCPPSPLLITRSFGGLVNADVELAVLYAQCRLGKRAAVAAYNAAREKLRAANKSEK